MKYNQPYGVTDPNAPYINGNPSTGQQGSIPPALSIEGPQRELHNFILKSGFTPADNDMMQLIKSIRRAFVNYGVDTGAVNTLIVTLDPPLEAYYAGMPLRVLVAHNSTGPCTVNVNGLGPRAIKTTTGLDLGPDDIAAGMIAYLIDDGSHYELMTKGGAVTGGTTSVDIPYAADSGPVNQIHAVYAPALTAIAEGKIVSVKVLIPNNDVVTFQPNALPALPLLCDDGVNQLRPGDLRPNEIILLENHSAYYQMLKPVPSQFRIKLNTNLTIWVRTDGDDKHFGTANDAAHAFLTIGAAMTYVRSAFDMSGQTVTVQLGIPGTYPVDPATGGVLGGTAGGVLVLRGDPANQDSYIINCVGTGGIPGITSWLSANGGLPCVAGRSTISGVKIVNNNEHQLVLYTFNGAELHVSNITLLSSNVVINNNNALLTAFTGSTIVIDGNIRFSSNTYACIQAWGGMIATGDLGGVSIVLSSTSNIGVTVAVARATLGGIMFFNPVVCSWAGTFTGYRYISESNSVINVNQAGVNYFPGTIAGYTTAGGQYS